MPTLPDHSKTTPDFCDALKRIRSLIGCSLPDLEEAAGVEPGWLAKLESPGSEVSESVVSVYDREISKRHWRDWRNVCTALTAAHYSTSVEPLQLKRSRMENTGASSYFILGDDLGVSRFEPFVADSCTLLPGAETILYEAEAHEFLRAAVDIAERRGAMTLIHAEDQTRYLIKQLVQTWKHREHTYTVGVPGYLPTTALAVDPIAGIHTLEQALLAAAALGASHAEQPLLAAAMLLIKVAFNKHNDTRSPILTWAQLDAAGPEAYADLVDDKRRWSLPPTDLSWSIARKYLSAWHSRYAQTLTNIIVDTSDTDLDFRSNLANDVDPDQAEKYLVIYDHDALPGIPAFLGMFSPALTLTPTQLSIAGPRQDNGDFWWLPTGIEGRILVCDHHGWWRALQIADF